MSLYTLGIEEEYLLVDRETRDLAVDPPDELFDRCADRCGEGCLAREFMRPQIEIGTRVCGNFAEVRKELRRLRGAVIDVTADYGLAPIASATHPFAAWHKQLHTDKERYNVLDRDMQGAIRRMLICGMHVHVGIESDDMRIRLMNQFTYFLPLILAMSCSSPFWVGEDSGLKSFRLTVFDGMTRTRLPERFDSFDEYQKHVALIAKGGLLEDATKVWWDMRPSDRYPTLEMRIADVCTNMEHALSLAALTVSLLHMLERLTRSNRCWRVYKHMLIYENRWRAMRYSFDEGMLDLARAELRPFEEILEELIEQVIEDARELACVNEVLGCRSILEQGTSAHRQLALRKQALWAGMAPREAMANVVDWLIEETATGVFGHGAEHETLHPAGVRSNPSRPKYGQERKRDSQQASDENSDSGLPTA
jgi:carboxylate-amine ligase